VRRQIVALALVVTATALVLLGASAQAGAPRAQAAAICADYRTQADAQRAADTRDPDGDGIYCVIYSE